VKFFSVRCHSQGVDWCRFASAVRASTCSCYSAVDSAISTLISERLATYVKPTDGLMLCCFFYIFFCKLSCSWCV